MPRYERKKPSPHVLRGMQAIADFLGVAKYTAWRYTIYKGLPAMKMPGGQWYTHKQLVWYWMMAGHDAAVQKYLSRTHPVKDARRLDAIYSRIVAATEPAPYSPKMLHNVHLLNAKDAADLEVTDEP